MSGPIDFLNTPVWTSNPVENPLASGEPQDNPVLPVAQGDGSLNLVEHAAPPAAAPVTGIEPEESCTRVNTPAVDTQSVASKEHPPNQLYSYRSMFVPSLQGIPYQCADLLSRL